MLLDGAAETLLLPLLLLEELTAGIAVEVEGPLGGTVVGPDVEAIGAVGGTTATPDDANIASKEMFATPVDILGAPAMGAPAPTPRLLLDPGMSPPAEAESDLENPSSLQAALLNKSAFARTFCVSIGAPCTDIDPGEEAAVVEAGIVATSSKEALLRLSVTSPNNDEFN